MRTVLVANRGEIARRIFRTCREMGLRTVAVYAEPDTDAAFVAEADLAVPLGGASPAESYLRIEALVAAARRCGADAVHPGYGFLAEDPDFARAVLDAGLTWVGPPPAAMAAAGSKPAARRVAAELGVPVVPGTGPGEDLTAAAGRLGYPLLVKAAAGGGGRGMRRVDSPADLDEALAAGAREAEAAFGDGTLYLERLLLRPRHVEVQIFGDAHGRVLALGTRDCSLQRRHQKLVEESPAPALAPDLAAALGEAAVRLGEAVGYVGAGTVEFLLAGGEFAFLEMNARLQVEHPVTEAVTGLDLVRLQLEVAAGGSLPAAPPPSRGHAIEARLYAEDPRAGFAPRAGRFHRLEVPTTPGVRVDATFDGHGEIGSHYDALLAKIVAHGKDRAEALRRLAASLRRARLHGPPTNRDLLVAVLEDEEFRAGPIDTGFIERRDPARLAAPPRGRTLLHAGVAALADQAARRATAPVLAAVRSGFRNLPTAPQRRVYATDEERLAVAYRFDRRGLELLRVEDEDLPVELLRAGLDRVEMLVAGIRRGFDVARHGDEVFVDGPEGSSRFTTVPRFPEPGEEEDVGSCRAPLPGTVVAVHVQAGETVAPGDPLLTLEAMKMEHALTAPAAGRVVRIQAAPGDRVEAGAVLVVIDDEP